MNNPSEKRVYVWRKDSTTPGCFKYIFDNDVVYNVIYSTYVSTVTRYGKKLEKKDDFRVDQITKLDQRFTNGRGKKGSKELHI